MCGALIPPSSEFAPLINLQQCRGIEDRPKQMTRDMRRQSLAGTMFAYENILNVEDDPKLGESGLL